MSTIQESQIKFSAGPAAANLYQTFSNTEYRLCFDWSYDYLYWKIGTNRDIEVNLLDNTGIDLIELNQMNRFIGMCEIMLEKTLYHNYNRVNENRARIMLLVAKLKKNKY
jgi:hypothetical protein